MTNSNLKRTIKQDLATIRAVLKLARRLNPWALITMITLQALETLIPLANIILPAMILDELTGAQNMTRLTQLVAITLGINGVAQLGRRALMRLRLHQRDRFDLQVMLEMAKATVTMDYEHAENPQTQLLRQKISDGLNWGGGIGSLISMLCFFGQGAVAAVLSFGIISQLLAIPATNNYSGLLGFIDSPVSAACLLALIFVVLLLNLKVSESLNRLNTDSINATLQDNRKYGYLMFNLFGNYLLGKDIRLYNMAPMLTEEMVQFMNSLNTKYIPIRKKSVTLVSFNQFASSLVTAFIYFFIALKAMVGTVPVSGILLYVGAINQFNQACTTMITRFSDIRLRTSMAQDLLDYLEMPVLKYRGSLPVEKRDDRRYEFELRNVSFKYPGSDNYTLRNINLKIRIGERMAIVGMNGSGKTTLIKLLCRLYDPSEGVILLNGIDIRKYKYEEYVSIFSVVFQDFKLFSLPLGQNVAAAVDFDAERAQRFLEQSGFDTRMQRMPKGLHTPLYKHIEDDGVEISGGEAQKIAIARALYKDAPFIILDEPTAALDPLSEAEIYARFNELIGDKTAIYISHRLSSCRFCQDIVVFHEGEIVQRGGHNQLLADASGKYAELWHAQAQYYDESYSSFAACGTV